VKRRIVADSLEPGANSSEVARRLDRDQGRDREGDDLCADSAALETLIAARRPAQGPGRA